jgi:DnaJ like chaperone protein
MQIAFFILSLVLVYFIYFAWRGNTIGLFFKGRAFRATSHLHDNGIQELFFNTAFTLMGYVARRDGPVNEKEIKRTETFMEKMNLNAPQKRQAIQLFKRGAAPDYRVNTSIDAFKRLARKSPNLTQILLIYLVSLARVDGRLVTKEIEAVQEVAANLGYSSITFEHLLKMLSSQDRFSDDQLNEGFQDDAQRAYGKAGTKKSEQSRTHKKRYRSFADDTEQSNCAYDALGLTPSASEAEVRKAYRTLANQFHPDKLIGQGLPPFMVKAMTERFQTIQSAYDCIKKEKANH